MGSHAVQHALQQKRGVSSGIDQEVTDDVGQVLQLKVIAFHLVPVKSAVNDAGLSVG